MDRRDNDHLTRLELTQSAKAALTKASTKLDIPQLHLMTRLVTFFLAQDERTQALMVGINTPDIRDEVARRFVEKMM